MNFYKRSINKQSRYFKRVLGVLREYDTRGYFHENHGHREAWPKTAKIFIGMKLEDVEGGTGKNDSIQSFLSGVCHELAHVLNYRNKKYYKYHNMGPKTRYTKKLVQNWIRTGYKAERYTDKVGAQLMKKHFPGIPYLLAYQGRHGYIWYQENYLKDLYGFMRGEISYD